MAYGPRRIHITGASGTGTTTLGAALAARLDVPHLDTDDFYWHPSSPPFQAKRPVAERLELLRAAFLFQPGWVLSGSINSWGDELAAEFDRVVFLYVPPGERIRRIEAREREHYGRDVDPGGPLHEQHHAFMEWSKSYDLPGTTGRSLVRHRAWLATLSCPVVEIYGTPTPEQSLDAVLHATSSRTRLEFPRSRRPQRQPGDEPPDLASRPR